MPEAKAITKSGPTHCTCPTYTTSVLGKDVAFGGGPRKPLSAITAADIPRGIDPYDIACACGFWTIEKYKHATKLEEGLR